MDPLRIAIRSVLAYAFLITILRLAGKRTLRHGSTFDFVLALILGDLIDDALWAEVPFAQFVVATTTLVLLKFAATLHKVLPRTR
jgi:uncharacterized membrane protein YcaP (DUF421 family)